MLSQISNLAVNNWLAKVEQNCPLTPFCNRRNQVSIASDCLFWSMDGVISLNLRGTVMQKLRYDHMGIVKMKSVARLNCWQPGIDQDIKNLGRSYYSCQREGNPHPSAYCLREYGHHNQCNYSTSMFQLLLWEILLYFWMHTPNGERQFKYKQPQLRLKQQQY